MPLFAPPGSLVVENFLCLTSCIWCAARAFYSKIDLIQYILSYLHDTPDNASKSHKSTSPSSNSRARKYAKGLTKATERLAAQVVILRKERVDHKEALGNRKQRQSGKRAAIKSHFILTTAEIRNKVKAAELETLRKKASKAPPQKRKRQATPLEDEIESTEESDSSSSDCIMVTQC